MNKKEKVILGGVVALGLLFASGAVLSQQQAASTDTTTEETTIDAERMAKYEQAAQEIKDNKPKTIVGEVFENGYLKKHGDHYHFVYGAPPADAIYEQKKPGATTSTVEDNYVFNPNDIVSENELGFVVRHGDHFHFIYRSQLANAQTVTREVEDNYVFNPNDIVSENELGFVVRHGDHFHYIKKSELSSTQLSQAKEAGVNPSLASSAAGVTTPTSDGYIFKGESDIIGRNSFGFIVQHGSHQHIIPYSQLRGTQWEYLLNDHRTTTNNTNTTVVNTPKTNIVNDNDHHEHSSDHGDNYKFDPKDIVSEDKYGYTVRHNDHYHYIPKPNNDSITTPLPSTPKPAVPAVDNKSDKNNNSIKPSILSFAGIQFKTSDGFILSDDSKTTPTSTGLLASHDGHEHFSINN